MPNPIVNLILVLPDNEAMALAQFLKRAGYSDYRALSASEDEAYETQAACETIRRALADAGYNPR